MKQWNIKEYCGGKRQSVVKSTKPTRYFDGRNMDGHLFVVGDEVKHRRYGKGKVSKVNGRIVFVIWENTRHASVEPKSISRHRQSGCFADELKFA